MSSEKPQVERDAEELIELAFSQGEEAANKRYAEICAQRKLRRWESLRLAEKFQQGYFNRRIGGGNK